MKIKKQAKKNPHISNIKEAKIQKLDKEVSTIVIAYTNGDGITSLYGIICRDWGDTIERSFVRRKIHRYLINFGTLKILYLVKEGQHGQISLQYIKLGTKGIYPVSISSTVKTKSQSN